MVTPAGRRGEPPAGGTITHNSGKPQASYSSSFPGRTSVVWSTSSTTSGKSSSPMTRERFGVAARVGCRYSVSSASIASRGRPSASRTSRVTDPYETIGAPRTEAIRSARWGSRRDVPSWTPYLSATTQAVSVRASQYSNRSSYSSNASRGSVMGTQPGNRSSS